MAPYQTPRERVQESGERSAGGSDVSFLHVPGLGQPCSGDKSMQHHPRARWWSSGQAS